MDFEIIFEKNLSPDFLLFTTMTPLQFQKVPLHLTGNLIYRHQYHKYIPMDDRHLLNKFCPAVPGLLFPNPEYINIHFPIKC